MNLDLIEQYGNGQAFPESLESNIDYVGPAITCSFNKWGTILAVGCNDGKISLVDFLTKSVAKTIIAHATAVCALSWSRDGRRLVSAAIDNTLCVWDVLSGSCIRHFLLPMPVLKVFLKPRDPIGETVLACPLKHPPLLFNVTTGKFDILKPVPIPSVDAVPDAASTPAVTAAAGACVACFSRRGDHILTGNAKGRIQVFKLTPLVGSPGARGNNNVCGIALVACFVLPGAGSPAIRDIQFARRGPNFLLNCSDKIIRVYDFDLVLDKGAVTVDKQGNAMPVGGAAQLAAIEPLQKLQDQVNKPNWIKCCFSGDGDYICGGSAKSHTLHIWEKNTGIFVKQLQGTKGEMLRDIVWHPVRPVICSVSSGILSVWSQSHVENWSAFAPDFKELDENVAYDERESEFDVTDEDKATMAAAIAKDESEDEEEVDVTTVTPCTAFLSSDEEDTPYDDNVLTFLRVTPEIDEEELVLAAAATNPGVSPSLHSKSQNAPVPPPAPTIVASGLPSICDPHPLLGPPAKRPANPSGGGGKNSKRPSTSK